MPITLIGFRGTGKSTVGPALAERLGWSCVDADAEIERRAGKRIAEIFAGEGEASFRTQEADVLEELLGRGRLVIAAGGGAPLSEVTRAKMRAAGPVVWLQASFETIWDRIAEDLAGGNRPPLTEHDPRTEVRTLLEKREPVYAEAASIVVRTDGPSVDELVEEILRQLPPLEEGRG